MTGCAGRVCWGMHETYGRKSVHAEEAERQEKLLRKALGVDIPAVPKKEIDRGINGMGAQIKDPDCKDCEWNMCAIHVEKRKKCDQCDELAVTLCSSGAHFMCGKPHCENHRCRDH